MIGISGATSVGVVLAVSSGGVVALGRRSLSSVVGERAAIGLNSGVPSLITVIL